MQELSDKLRRGLQLAEKRLLEKNARNGKLLSQGTPDGKVIYGTFARKRKGINKKINSLKERMKGKKRIIVTLLFFINIIMLVAAVIPHHHHPNGMICMKQDLPVEQQCPTHHHHPGNDSCCSSECMTRFYSPTPSVHTDSGPDYVFIATLFTDVIIEHLLRPQEKRIKNYYVYRDSLHGTDTHRTTSLRAPPYSVFA